MSFTFYKNTADNRKVNKTSDLTQIKSISSVIFKNDTDRGDISLDLSYDPLLLDVNYCYDSNTGYYYFLSEPIFSQQRLLFKGMTDLLMTYKDDIFDLGCIIARQENIYNAYLNDERFPVLNKQAVTTLAFPQGFSNSEELLMIVNGGGGENVSTE